MDSKKHSSVTGAKATISRRVGGAFSVFDGYAHGTNVELVKDKRIVQEWRAEEPGWPDNYFSRVTFELAAVKGGTKLTFTHAGVPTANAKSIADGWREYYWEPLQRTFARI